MKQSVLQELISELEKILGGMKTTAKEYMKGYHQCSIDIVNIIKKHFLEKEKQQLKEKDLEISLLQSKIEELQEDLRNKQAGAPWMQ